MKKIKMMMLGTCLSLAACALMLAQSASATVMYEFTGGLSPFDQDLDGGLGAFETLVDGDTGISVTLTTIDIIGWDGSRASEGTNHTTNVSGTTGTSLGVNSATTPPGATSDFQNFDPGEGWVISFNVDVELVEIDMASQLAGAEMTLSSPVFSSFVLEDGQTGDTHDLGNLFLPAGTELTFLMTSEPTAADTTIRINDLTVASIIPEPSSLILVLIGAVAFVARRSRTAKG